jgi:hypothetical protein
MHERASAAALKAAAKEVSWPVLQNKKSECVLPGPVEELGPIRTNSS